MTQISLADDTMAIVDAKALTSQNLKSCASMMTSETDNVDAPCEPVDNQNEDMDADAAAETVARPVSKQDRRITFSTADVIEFEPTLWTATVASDGVPVGLSSSVRRRTRRRLDSLESERLLYRVNRQDYMEHGYLEPEERIDILEAAGHSLAIMSHVERESMRVNRERWESNEYDLLYQFGLGEKVIMDLNEQDELLLSQGTISGFHNQYDDAVELADEDDEMLEPEDEEEGNPADYYYYSNGEAAPTESDLRCAMDEIDSYDTRKYEEWAWDYNTDCILEDDNDQYSKDSAFDLPSLDFGLPEMSSSPTDVASGDNLIVSCSKVIGLGSPSPSQSKSTSSSSPRLFV